MRNRACPLASVVACTTAAPPLQATVIPWYGCAVAIRVSKQDPKSRLTSAPATGLFATSRTTTTNWPSGSATPPAAPTSSIPQGIVLFAVQGTPKPSGGHSALTAEGSGTMATIATTVAGIKQ